jgi:hypothetical protein
MERNCSRVLASEEGWIRSALGVSAMRACRNGALSPFQEGVGWLRWGCRALTRPEEPFNGHYK